MIARAFGGQILLAWLVPLTTTVVRFSVDLRTLPAKSLELVRAAQSLTIPTRLEPGCVSCTVGIEKGPVSTIHYEEVWTTEDAMRRRVRSDRFTQVLALMEAATESPDVRFEFGAETRGLDYIAANRDEPS